MQIIPIIATPSQTLTTLLADQACRINVYQKTTGLYVDLYVNNAAIATGVLAQNASRIVRYGYLGFIGDLAICDTSGSADPDYTGLGDRFVLVYYTADEL